MESTWFDKGKIVLPEKIHYPYDFPLNIIIGSVDEYPLHYHQDVELVYVLRGEIKLKNGSCEYILPEGSIFANNGKEVHGFYKTKKQNVVAIIHLNNIYFTKYYPALSLSSYRTFALKETDSRYNQLRKISLKILSSYLKKSVGHKQDCIDTTIKLIGFLNENFNFFAIEKNLVISPHYEDLVLIERMSRIIPYLYEHHSEKISLEELSQMEHLSTFYISHMIKSCTGLSFREFLCFARVEYSEMLLLDSNSKVNIVAKQVGFSTTAYYEKFFKLWYGRTPEAHKARYLPQIKSSSRHEKIEETGMNQSASIVGQCVSAVGTQVDHDLQVKSLKSDIDVDLSTSDMSYVCPKFEIEISLSDYHKLGNGLFTILCRLNCNSILLVQGDDDISERVTDLKIKLENKGFLVEIKNACAASQAAAYGLDSVANLVRVFHENLLSTTPIKTKLMDSGPKESLLKGDSGLLTSSGAYKPVYYACLALAQMKGRLVSLGKWHAILQTKTKEPCFIIAVFNYSDSTDQICSRRATPYEVEDVLNNFNDELDTHVNIPGLRGEFVIKKYSFASKNSLFGYMAKLGFPQKYNSKFDLDLNFYTTPDTDMTTETVTERLSLNFLIEGVGLQLATIEAIDHY
jgi:AraC-like DNA-binding protein